MKSVSIYGVGWIGESAFENCRKLNYVTMSEVPTYFKKSAFKGCENIKSVYITDLAKWCRRVDFANRESNPLCYGGSLYCNGELVTDIVIPDGIEEDYYDDSLCKNTFSGCSSITSVTIPDDIYSIEDSVFYGCRNLRKVSINWSTPLRSSRCIGNSSFLGCENLEEVHISDLKEWCNVKFNKSEDNPLYYAKSLYLNDDKIQGLYIPNGVKTINKYAFSGCKSLSSLTIPPSVTEIGDEAFSEIDFDSITVINCLYDKNSSQSSVMPLKYNVFSDKTKQSAILYVPKNSSKVYDKAFSWNYFENIQEKNFLAETPVITVNKRRVSIESNTSCAPTYYTLDGSTPTTSSKYIYGSKNFKINNNATIKAFTVSPYFDKSDVATETATDILNPVFKESKIVKIYDGDSAELPEIIIDGDTLNLRSLSGYRYDAYKLSDGKWNDVGSIYNVRNPGKYKIDLLFDNDSIYADISTEISIKLDAKLENSFSIYDVEKHFPKITTNGGDAVNLTLIRPFLTAYELDGSSRTEIDIDNAILPGAYEFTISDNYTTNESALINIRFDYQFIESESVVKYHRGYELFPKMVSPSGERVNLNLAKGVKYMNVYKLNDGKFIQTEAKYICDPGKYKIETKSDYFVEHQIVEYIVQHNFHFKQVENTVRYDGMDHFPEIVTEEDVSLSENEISLFKDDVEAFKLVDSEWVKVKLSEVVSEGRYKFEIDEDLVSLNPTCIPYYIATQRTAGNKL